MVTAPDAKAHEMARSCRAGRVQWKFSGLRCCVLIWALPGGGKPSKQAARSVELRVGWYSHPQ